MALKIGIIYFSGTGNTEYISRYIEQHLLASGKDAIERNKLEIKRRSIEHMRPEEMDNFNIIIFGFPIFELNSPEIVQDFLKEYKKLQET
ncbi:MAG: flavodoxin family protein, partial [Promethearchaeota archaeon]